MMENGHFTQSAHSQGFPYQYNIDAMSFRPQAGDVYGYPSQQAPQGIRYAVPHQAYHSNAFPTPPPQQFVTPQSSAFVHSPNPNAAPFVPPGQPTAWATQSTNSSAAPKASAPLAKAQKELTPPPPPVTNRTDVTVPPYANPVTAARHALESVHINTNTSFWPRDLREFVAGLPTCPPDLAERLNAPVHSNIKLIGAEERNKARAALVQFCGAFRLVDEKNEQLPVKDDAIFEVPGCDLTEVTDTMLKLTRRELCKRLLDTSLITKPEYAWPRGLRIFLSGLPIENTPLRAKLFYPINPETLAISDEDRKIVNNAIKAYLDNANMTETRDETLEILPDHDLDMDKILEESSDTATCCKRMIKSEYMRKSNAYWPRRLRDWAT
eukprot:CAMPEP_0176413462 /NCGR_PEP_ID=MMETSP0127-20121128/4714_1 /TAXON_ID=938130 /ORGANISM="Platyophrya macrostoma, Strain WH" /LENGTH=381 /DNA_ID=CAMNT_0017793249 /DNA_START=312 /DNA_END=1453 /DNA_ORIENTATION=-